MCLSRRGPRKAECERSERAFVFFCSLHSFRQKKTRLFSIPLFFSPPRKWRSLQTSRSPSSRCVRVRQGQPVRVSGWMGPTRPFCAVSAPRTAPAALLPATPPQIGPRAAAQVLLLRSGAQRCGDAHTQGGLSRGCAHRGCLSKTSLPFHRKRSRSSTRTATAPSPPRSWAPSCGRWGRTRRRRSCR